MCVDNSVTVKTVGHRLRERHQNGCQMSISCWQQFTMLSPSPSDNCLTESTTLFN